MSKPEKKIIKFPFNSHKQNDLIEREKYAFLKEIKTLIFKRVHLLSCKGYAILKVNKKRNG